MSQLPQICDSRFGKARRDLMIERSQGILKVLSFSRCAFLLPLQRLGSATHLALSLFK
jgi:hypothetical protein